MKNHMTKKTNEKFFEQIRPHLGILKNYCKKFVDPRVIEAEDLVQETMVKAIRFSKSFQAGTNLRAWLFRIMKNVYINEHRKHFSNGKRELSRTFAFSSFQNPTEESDNDNDYFFEFGLAQPDFLTANDCGLPDGMLEIIDKLDVGKKTCILLLTEGFDYHDIAECTGIPISTVRSKIHRARMILSHFAKEFGVELKYFDNCNLNRKAA